MQFGDITMVSPKRETVSRGHQAVCRRRRHLHTICRHLQNVNDFPFPRGERCGYFLHEESEQNTLQVNNQHCAIRGKWRNSQKEEQFAD